MKEKKITKKELKELIEKLNSWSVETGEYMSEIVVSTEDLNYEIEMWFKE